MPLTAVIVGAGIGGLSSAVALRRSGFTAEVYDQAPALGDVGAGIGLWPGAIRSLEELGVADWFWQLRTCPFRWAETAAPDGRVLTGFEVTGMTAGAAGFVVRRSELHRALIEQLDPAQVTLNARATAVQQHGDHVTVRFADGREATGDIVIGADGLRSVVRASLFGASEPRYSGETCYRGLADFAVADTGMLREVQGRGLRAAVHPLDDRQVYWWAARRAPAGLLESAEQRKEVLTRLYDGWHFGFPEALAATPADTILKNDLYDRPPLRPWSKDRVTLLGDAAHPTTPNLGLGGCMAIEDGLVLARSMAQHGGNYPPAFRQYEQERRRRTTRVVRMSHWFGRVGSMTSPAAVRGRQLVMRLTPAPAMAATFRQAVAFTPGPLRD